MTSSCLSHAVDTWTCQAISASRFLQRLYRVLGDDKQAANAIQAGGPAEERGQRLGLGARLAAFRIVHGQESPEDALGEARAWELMVEAQAGICAFHALADGHSDKARGLQGARNAATKAFDRALLGYRVAFPEELAEEGIQRAIVRAATTCAQTFVDDLESDDTLENREALQKQVRLNVLEALLQAVGSIAIDPALLENDGIEEMLPQSL